MPPVPVLMVLYSGDAVEVRYSDGTCLELSPCGSTVIHHEAPTRRNHIRQDNPQKIQKRTRFVTSEHRHKVLQAIDFRNRFAEKPYLCEDLLPREDILTLYAKIDSIAWPKQPENAKIELQPDGSKRITSLDEFASLVVSPHGHDFTVCYLSRISEDKNSSKRISSRHHPSSQFTSTRSPASGDIHEQSGETDKICASRPNEAIVHPFEATNQKELSSVQVNNGTFHPGIPQELQSSIYGTLNSNEDKGIEKQKQSGTECQKDDVRLQMSPLESRPQSQDNDSNLASGMIHKMSQDGNTNEQETSCDACIISEGRKIPLNNNILQPQEEKHQPILPFDAISPDSHDISSISRSSTPDDLRTTIDSDATLIHNNTDIISLGRGQVYKQRHSSPTQYTSSPYDEETQRIFNKAFQEKADISLSGSFLGNKDHFSKQPPCWQTDLYKNCKEDRLSQGDNLQSQELSNISCAKSADGLDIHYLPAEKTQPLEQLLVQSSSCTKNNQLTSDTAVHTYSLNSNHNINNSIRHTMCKNAEQSNFCIQSEPNEQKNCPFRNIMSRSVLMEKSSDYFMLNRQSSETEKQHRHRYMWTTRHASRNDCPRVWSHSLKLALQAGMLTNEDLSIHPTQRRLQEISTSFKMDNEKCTVTSVPSPLPLTCPFQHIHKWTVLDENYESGESTSNAGGFQHGRLKIVISEGVVYRFVENAEMKIVEIHPGDGSMLVSQGIKGHFFTHYVLAGDQIEEKTYSLKSLPPSHSKDRYSIGKLIKTANSFMLMNSQWDRRGLKEDVPCWKKEIVAVVEPLSTSLLEECHVEGLGKFSAFSNGRVRVVFENRVALDMLCNFSRRVGECLKHSPEMQIYLPGASTVSPPVVTHESIFCGGTGRLLLPNGKYVNVDINSPGPYRKYTQAAQEWASWVNSSPLERQNFYSQLHLPSVIQQAVELELRKIFCFNYILEQTVLQQPQHEQSETCDLSRDSGLPASSSSSDAINPQRSASSSNNAVHRNLTTGECPFPHYSPTYSESLPSPACSVYKNSGERKYPAFMATPLHDQCLSQTSFPSFQNQMSSTPRTQVSGSSWSQAMEEKMRRKAAEITQGFLSVKQVLLQNSKLISDIDAFLESSKNL